MKWKHILILLFLLPAISGFCKEKFTFSGIIHDADSGKALNGIDIVIKDQNTGTITNLKGTFLLHLDEGRYNVTVSGKGYAEKEVNIDLSENIEKDIMLAPSKDSDKKPNKKKERKIHLHSTLLSLL